MVVKVTWSPRAIAAFKRTIEYLELEWTEKEVTNFVDAVDDKLELLMKQPRVGTLLGKPNYFKTQVHKRVTLVYHFKPLKKEIELITFWNHWQNPAKLKF
jgi:plasmid stabilization system protein ParE